MSRKSSRKSTLIKLDAANYGALQAYARLRRARRLSAAARLAIIEFSQGKTAPNMGARDAKPRLLRVQLEPELRLWLQQNALTTDLALRAYLSTKKSP